MSWGESIQLGTAAPANLPSFSTRWLCLKIPQRSSGYRACCWLSGLSKLPSAWPLRSVTRRAEPPKRSPAHYLWADAGDEDTPLKTSICPGQYRVKQRVRRRVAEGAMLVAGHQGPELAVGLKLHRGQVHPLHGKVFHHAAAGDVAGAAVGAASGQQQIFQGVKKRAQVRLAQVKHHDVGLSAGRQPAKVVAPQRCGAAQRGSVVQVGDGGLVGVAFHHAREVQANLHVVQQVGWPGVGAQAEPDAGRPVFAKRVQCIAAACKHRRAVRHSHAGAGQAGPVVIVLWPDFRVLAGVNAVRQDGARRQQPELLQPAQRGGVA